MDEYKDFPAWVNRRLVEERLTPNEWLSAEKLRERFIEFGMELRPLGPEDEPTGVYADWKGGWAGETFQDDFKPLYEALHRLVTKVARQMPESPPWWRDPAPTS